MRPPARLNVDPIAWLLILMVGGIIATFVYVALTSITF